MRRKGLSGTAKKAIVAGGTLIGVAELNDFGRKVLAEGRTPAQAGKEIAAETVEGIKSAPGMIASVPGEAIGTAEAWSAADRAATQARREQLNRQFNRNLYRGDEFRPFAGATQEAEGMLGPLTGAAEGAGEVIKGYWDQWKWLIGK
jgi:hypothetical protein